MPEEKQSEEAAPPSEESQAEGLASPSEENQAEGLASPPEEKQPEELASPPEERQSEDVAARSAEHEASEVDEVTLMREQLDEALREKNQFRAMAQRAQADLVNYKRRAEEERGELIRNTNAQLLLKTLNIADDLNRALDLAPDGAAAPGWLEGLQLIQRNLDNILKSEGVVKIEASGQPFEPREHEAVFYEETSEGEEGIVISVIRDGYKLHGRVLRAAQVTVSKAPDPESLDPTTQEEA